MLTKTVGQSVTSGLLWLGAQTVCGRVVSFISQLILAKILYPEDFGLIGISLTITSIASTVCLLGIDQILQKRAQFARLWGTQGLLVVAGISAGITVIVLLGAAEVFWRGNSRLGIMVGIIALAIPLTALSALPQVLIQNSFRFRFLATFTFVEQVVLQTLTIVLVYITKSPNGFAVATVAAAVVRLVVFWHIAPLQLRKLSASKGRLRLLSSGAVALGSRLSAVLIDQCDYLIIALFASVRDVGLYFFAFKLSAQATRMLAMNIINVLLPSLVRETRSLQANSAITASEALCYFTIPIGFTQIVLARPLILVFFGSKWEDAIIYMQVLSIGIPFDAMAWPVGALLGAQAKYGKSLKISLSFTTLFFALILIGGSIMSGIGIAIAVSLYYFWHGVIYAHLIYPSQGIPRTRINAALVMPCLACMCSYIPPLLVERAFISSNNNIGKMAVTVCIFPVLYILFMGVFSPDITRRLKQRVLGMLQRAGYVLNR